MDLSAKTQPKAAVLEADVPFHSVFGLARHVAAAGLAAGVTGLVVGGLGGRVVMRIAGALSGSQGAGRVTEAGFTVGEISVAGSVFLVIFIGVVSALFSAGAFLLMRPWLGWAGRLRGLVFGLALFALASATSDVMNPDNPDFRILGNEPGVVALVAALFLAFGIVTNRLYTHFDTRFQPEEEGFTSVGVGYGVFAVLGAIAAIPMLAAVLSGGDGVCGCEAPVWASRSFLVVAISTAIVWIAAITRLPGWTVRVATITGFLGTAGVFVFGLVRAVSDAVEIIT
jgi:hypothetical protein